MSESSKLNIDDLSRSGPYGTQRAAYAEVTRGLNHMHTASILPMNQDAKGFVFWTRPQLNMSTQNVRAVRQTTPLASSQRNSLQRAFRVLLDPELVAENPSMATPLVDQQLAFIPWLTNLLQTVSGWPDEISERYTTPAGVAGQQWSMIDSQYQINGEFQLTATFQNFVGDPIGGLMSTWLKMPQLCFMGLTIPRLSPWVSRRLDYTTRPYRFIMDPSMTYIQKYAIACAAFPVGMDTGRQFDYDINKPLISPGEFTSVQFNCLGARYNDPLALVHFNKHVELCNPNMKEGSRKATMRKVPSTVKSWFNYRAYPRVNLRTMELEWWVPLEVYNQVVSARNQIASVLEK
jgi:hypothetical protein